MRSAKTVSYRSVFVVMMAIAFMSVYAFADITGTESQDNPAFSNVQVTSFDQNVQKGPVRVAKDYSNYDYSRGYHLELDTPIDVLVAPAEDTFTDNLLGFLTEFDEIDEFGYFDARTGTPTLEALQEWDVVITYANNGYNDRPAMGNVLAEYVEEGGAVILTLFAFYSGWEITGSFSTDGYFPITPAGADFGLGAMDEYDEDHPIMTDVGDVSGYYRGSGALTEGSEEVATYANGSVFVATKEIDGAMVIAINDFVKGEMWTGDMDLVLANAIIFAYEGGGEPDATVEGIITDSETEDPVEGAEISIGRATATSGEDGAFFLEDVVSGEGKRVNIIAEGYFPYSEEHDIDVEENEIDFAIDILSADVTGVVSDEMTEEFLSGATVECIEVETGEVFLEVTTDDTGAYVAPALHHDVTYMIVASMTGYAPSDTEEVTINYENEYTFDFELTPIFERTVRQLQQEQDPETWVTCTGVVTQGTNVTNTENTELYVQDESGYGILVWDEDAWDPENDIMRGDEVIVIGYLLEEDDITMITIPDIEVIGNDNPLPEPRVEGTGDMSTSRSREGTWAQMSGQINRDPPGEGDYSLIVDDGSGQCEVKIFETTGIDLTDLVADDWATFTGVIGLSRQGIRLIPNMQEDVARIPIDPPSDLAATQEVIPGDPLSLEVTLTWTHDHLDDWLGFYIYRDGVMVDSTVENTWSEIIEDPAPGEYASYTWAYTVTTSYDEGETDPSNEVEVIWDITSVEERQWAGVPLEWALEAVYPNPFNPTLHVVLSVPQTSKVTVEIIDILGRRVAMLHQGDLAAAYHRLNWNATSNPTGIYFLRVSSSTGFNDISKVMFIK